MIATISALAIASALFAPPTPQDALKGAIDHYKTLKSFSMTIEHKDSSGLYPGSFTQTLRWKKSAVFELLVTKKSSVAPSPGKSLTPNCYCDGGPDVTSVFADGTRQDRPLAHGPETSPGWEVTGGLIFSSLLGSPSADLFSNLPAEMNAKWSFGNTTKWNGEAVKEIVLSASSGTQRMKASFMLSKDGKRLVGFSWDNGGGRPGWARYKNQVENGPMPKDLGKAPKAK
jgi:hypothetical protein